MVNETESSFYSKLVRLKAGDAALPAENYTMFLFQIGAIKRLLINLNSGFGIFVSIPNWCD